MRAALRSLAMVLAGVVAVVGFCSPACAREQQEIRVVDSNDFGVTLELVLPPFTVENVLGTDGTYQRIALQGWAKTSVPGFPELPVKSLLVQVPQTGRVTVELTESSVQSLSGQEIYPVPELAPSGQAAVKFLKNEAAYQSGEYYPAEAAEVLPRSILRTVPVCRLMIHPFQWNPLTRELRVFKKMRLHLRFDDPLPSPVLDRMSLSSPAIDDTYEGLLQESVINYRKVAAVEQMPAASEGTSTVVSATAVTALRIEVTQNGITRLGYRDLLKAGVAPKYIDPQTFQLFNRGKELAIRVVTKAAGQFGLQDYIEFYGQGIDNVYTGTNVYQLVWGKANGKRMAVLKGTVTGKGTRLTTFYDTIRIEENHVMWEAMPDAPQKDYWFWEKLLAPVTKSYTFNLPAAAAGQGDVLVRVCFRGYTTAPPHPNHRTRISLNGTLIGESSWDGTMEYIQDMRVPSGLLVAGANTVSIALPGDTGAAVDGVYFNWIEFGFQRPFDAVEDQVTFNVRGTGRFLMEVGKLSAQDVAVYDITSPYGVKSITNFQIAPDGAAYKVAFESTLSGRRTYCVLDSTAIVRPAKIEPWRSANLKSTVRGADYILITAREFLPSVRPLCTFRQNHKLRSIAVAVEDIYNEFSYGLIDPQAIKDFLAYAYQNWRRPAPTYVLLVGDANTDYRDYFGTGKKGWVPVHLSITSLGLTPDDNWYVSVDGDDILPDMFIGRIPASSAAVAADMVNKVLRYERLTGYQPKKALFAADNNEPSFQQLDDSLAAYLPANFEARKVYLSAYSDAASATRDIISSIDEGMLITTYVGHGDVTHWAGEPLFDPTSVGLLNNVDKLTFVISLECLNNYFSNPFRYSLGEAFVLPPDTGAIASFSTSSLGYSYEHEILGNKMFSAIFKEGKNILGAITTQSKIDAYAQGATSDLVVSFTLLGDPATKLKIRN